MAQRQKKLNWKSISKKGKNFEILLIDCVAQAFIKMRKEKRVFGAFYPTAYRQFEADRWMIKEDVDRFIKKAMKKEARRPGSILRSYLAYEKMLNDLIRFGQTLNNADYSKYSNKKLVSLLEKYFWLGGKPIIYGYNYYFYQFMGDDLKAVIDRKIKVQGKRDKLFEILTQAKKLSYMQQSQKDLLEFVGSMSRQKIKINSATFLEWVEQHLKKFAFMGMYFFRGAPWQRGDIVKRIRYWQKEDHKGELRNFEQLDKDSANWKKYAKEINFSKKEQIMVETIKQMSYCTNLYDEAWSHLTYSSRKLISEATNRLGVGRNEFIQMTIHEIISALSSGTVVSTRLRKSLQKRIKDSCYLMVGNTTRIISGKQLTIYRGKEKIRVVVSKRTSVIQGQTASPGKAVGKVTILSDVAELSKVKKGDVLVAKCTVPAFLPAMERASAFVTETGGLLSHAAIVAREIKKPCVIGVENVMRIFKDGDRVEVDATRGVIKKL